MIVEEDWSVGMSHHGLAVALCMSSVLGFSSLTDWDNDYRAN